jgi:hypothetical protein
VETLDRNGVVVGVVRLETERMGIFFGPLMKCGRVLIVGVAVLDDLSLRAPRPGLVGKQIRQNLRMSLKIFSLRRSCLASRSSIRATWSTIGSPWPERTISAGISRVFFIDSM